MTELEQQLTTALTRLSRQYSLEQQQQAELITALSRQVEQLTKQVSTLAHSYRRLTKLWKEE
jgi:predicted phage tail protein